MKNKKSSENKFCKDCLVFLNENNTNKYDIKAAQYVCTSCRKHRDKKRYENRKELIREKQRVYDLSVKTTVIEAYGGKCVCCNENTLEFLTIDHINNDDTDNFRENSKKSGGKLYRWLITNNFPEGKYQILCYNCNCAKGFFGYCPHNKPEFAIIPTRKRIKT